MKAVSTLPQLRRKRMAARRLDQALLRSGRATPRQIQKRNSWFSSRKAMAFNPLKLAAVLAQTA